MFGLAERKAAEANARAATLASVRAARNQIVATPHASPEATAFAFGAMLQREYGNDWPRLIGIATQAAMQADHEVTE
jgi:hypothetical protein